MGVSSKEWLAMSDGKGYMPAILMDGEMYMESAEIVKSFAEQYPDTTLSDDERAEVMKWIDFNLEKQEMLVEAEKHWDTAALSPDKPNYVTFGPGRRDAAWEKGRIKFVDDFFKTLDKHFEGNKENDNIMTYYVGDKMTLADCAMINWPLTFSRMARLNVKGRYPNLWAHHEAFRDSKPDGADEHWSTIPFLRKVISVLLLWTRGIINYGHHIENPKNWE
jgi:glutathione S-transferase